uniref:Uncharacterized protein n=1 Tax=mine drainage metagenome TaxID=410659 RepID=E6PN37_9ZZZZ
MLPRVAFKASQGAPRAHLLDLASETRKQFKSIALNASCVRLQYSRVYVYSH